MVNLFADIPKETINSTLLMIKKNLAKVNLYGGHTLRRHADIQVMALKIRLTNEDIRFATSYWDFEIAVAVVQGIMRRYYDTEIAEWLRHDYGDCLPLFAKFNKTLGYGFKKDHEQLEENLRKACLVLVKDSKADWGFRILTSYPMF